MKEVEFIYEDKKIIIQCNENDKIKDICKRFASKLNLEMNSLFFICGGEKINLELSFINLANTMNKESNKISIIVFENKIKAASKNVLKMKEVICPKCGENARLKIEKYKFTLFECKNGHKINNILLNEFGNTQIINLSNIKCDNCKENDKENTYKNKFFNCISCNKNLCPLCKLSHDKTHNIIDYDLKNYICAAHNEIFNSYCKKCKKNTCIFCEPEHKSHDMINYSKLLPNKDIKMNEIKELKSNIDIFKNSLNDFIEDIKRLLNEFIENLETLYNINYNIINNYNEKERNYQILQNLNNLNTNVISKDINQIINNKNIGMKLNKIVKIYSQMRNIEIEKSINNESNIIENNEDEDEYSSDINFDIKKIKNLEKENNEITLKYKNDKIVKIFGSVFVKNNKDKCCIEFKGRNYQLQEYFRTKEYDQSNFDLIIKLKGINNISNMCSLFEDCKALLEISNLSNWNTNSITNMSNLFKGCSSLKSLDVSKFETNNVKDMSYMFYKCSDLSNLSDISKWNTTKVTNMKNMFSYCSSLYSLPDISKWITNNVTDMSGMFCFCSSLNEIPDLSEWNISKVNNLSSMFENCKSLNSLPDISNWNTNNVIDMSYIFENCSSLKILPYISKWNTNNVINMSSMFEKCSSLTYFPEISNWNTEQVKNMSYLFSNCTSLTALPDI